MSSIIRDTSVLHPVMRDCVERIERSIIKKHSLPMQLFETGRSQERQRMLFSKGKVLTPISEHLFDLDENPPLLATAMCFVYCDETGWSWNLRNNRIKATYIFFGEMVLDFCPEIEWLGYNRVAVDYTLFRLRKDYKLRVDGD